MISTIKHPIRLAIFFTLNGQGCSFEYNGKMIFLFGDTISEDVNAVNYHAVDPLAWSTSTDPEAGLLLNFYTESDGSRLSL